MRWRQLLWGHISSTSYVILPPLKICQWKRLANFSFSRRSLRRSEVPMFPWLRCRLRYFSFLGGLSRLEVKVEEVVEQFYLSPCVIFILFTIKRKYPFPNFWVKQIIVSPKVSNYSFKVKSFQNVCPHYNIFFIYPIYLPNVVLQ